MKVPFSPYFLQQVQAGKVKSISAKGDTVKGTFAAKVRYPPTDKKAKPTTLFSTQVPECGPQRCLIVQAAQGR